MPPFGADSGGRARPPGEPPLASASGLLTGSTAHFVRGSDGARRCGVIFGADRDPQKGKPHDLRRGAPPVTSVRFRSRSHRPGRRLRSEIRWSSPGQNTLDGVRHATCSFHRAVHVPQLQMRLPVAHDAFQRRHRDDAVWPPNWARLTFGAGRLDSLFIAPRRNSLVPCTYTLLVPSQRRMGNSILARSPSSLHAPSTNSSKVRALSGPTFSGRRATDFPLPLSGISARPMGATTLPPSLRLARWL